MTRRMGRRRDVRACECDSARAIGAPMSQSHGPARSQAVTDVTYGVSDAIVAGARGEKQSHVSGPSGVKEVTPDEGRI